MGRSLARCWQAAEIMGSKHGAWVTGAGGPLSAADHRQPLPKACGHYHPKAVAKAPRAIVLQATAGNSAFV